MKRIMKRGKREDKRIEIKECHKYKKNKSTMLKQKNPIEKIMLI